MAKTDTPNKDNTAVDDGLNEENSQAQAAPVSDSRARRKRKRGEFVEPVAEQPVAGATEKKDRPTPGRRNKAAKAPAKSAAASPIQRVVRRIPGVRGLYNYLVAAITEMKKVTWPNREETQRLTRMVIIITIIFSMGLGLLDIFYGWWFRQALDEKTLFLGVAAIVAVVAGIFTWFVFSDTTEYRSY